MIEPPPWPCHHRNHVLHRKKGALQVDREHAVPFRLCRFDDAAHLGNADIVVEHVDPAVGADASGHHRLDLTGARDVGGERNRSSAFARDDLHGLLGGRGAAIDAEHLRALARKGDRGRLAVAPAGADRAGADHHRRLALEPIHRLLPFSLLSCLANAHSDHVSTDRIPENSPQRANSFALATTNFPA